MTKTRILLVDDHRIIREGLKSLLQNEPDLTVVGEADNGRRGVELAAELLPDVVVMDIQMPQLNGIDATRQALAANPRMRVVCLSASNDERFAHEMLRAGATGYVAKDAAFEELTTAIRAVVAGTLYMSPSLRGVLASDAKTGVHNGLNGHNGTNGFRTGSAFQTVSEREREVLQLIAEGKSTKEVAAALHLSVKTVETHRRNMMEKLGLDSVAELTKYAIREGITAL